MPAPLWAARTLECLGGFRDVRDLSRLREGEEARREARERVDGVVCLNLAVLAMLDKYVRRGRLAVLMVGD